MQAIRSLTFEHDILCPNYSVLYGRSGSRLRCTCLHLSAPFLHPFCTFSAPSSSWLTYSGHPEGGRATTATLASHAPFKSAQRQKRPTLSSNPRAQERSGHLSCICPLRDCTGPRDCDCMEQTCTRMEQYHTKHAQCQMSVDRTGNTGGLSSEQLFGKRRGVSGLP